MGCVPLSLTQRKAPQYKMTHMFTKAVTVRTEARTQLWFLFSDSPWKVGNNYLKTCWSHLKVLIQMGLVFFFTLRWLPPVTKSLQHKVQRSPNPMGPASSLLLSHLPFLRLFQKIFSSESAGFISHQPTVPVTALNRNLTLLLSYLRLQGDVHSACFCTKWTLQGAYMVLEFTTNKIK